VGFKVIDALRALHSADPPILHLDVKPENLLYESEAADAELLVTDFGLARVYESAADIGSRGGSSKASSGRGGSGGGPGRPSPDKRGGGGAPPSPKGQPPPKQQQQQQQRLVGTVGYMAPEVITRRHYTPAADLFSAGVVLYTLLVGYPPFAGKLDAEVLQNTAAGKWGMPESRGWCDVSSDAKRLVTRLLDVDPLTRCTAEEALNDPWLAAAKPVYAAATPATPATPAAPAAAADAAAVAAVPFPEPLPPPLGPSLPRAAHSALADQLPTLRGSQERMREFNDQRTTQRLSRAAEFVLSHNGGGGGASAGDVLPQGLGGDSSVINLMAPQVRGRKRRAPLLGEGAGACPHVSVWQALVPRVQA
jgi:hypothetical protein